LHRIVEKVPVVTADHLDETSTYPRPATIQCVVVAQGVDGAGGRIITVDTSLPWYIESTSGASMFVVRPDQLEDAVDAHEPGPNLGTDQPTQLRAEQPQESQMKADFDGARIDGWDAFHDQSAAVFGFPDFYGRNMNAWIDCLIYVREGDGMSRFTLGPEAPLVVEVANSQVFRERAPEIFTAFLDGVTFVNNEQRAAGETPALQLLLL
jgi:hypothetical protein